MTTFKDVFFFNTPLPAEGLPLFDSHCHIQFDDFAADRDQVIQRSKDAGLHYLVVVGTDLESSKQALQLAKQYPDYIFATVGNHPYDADKSMDGFQELIEQNPEYIVAVGETGLDYFKNKLDPEIQKQSFRKHCLLAKKFDLPIIIHNPESVDCYPDTKAILLETQVTKAIFHCYSGDLQTAEDIWQNGWKTSFALNITYPKNNYLYEIARACPPHLNLVETDSPYLSPQSKRGQRNEPSYLNG